MNQKIAALAAIAVGALPSPSHADEAQLRAEIAELRAVVKSMQTEMAEIRRGAAVPAAPATASTSPSTGSPAPIAPSPVAAHAADESGTHLWGYGQINVNRPTADASATQADVTRAVLGFSHSFDDQTRVVGEFEWEHTIVSADDAGESEVEQLYVEHMLTPQSGLRLGLQLMPFGFINEHHEPTQFYGVERNLVETAIIPSTWREGGIGWFGSTDAGLQWNVGVVTGHDLSKWDPTSDDGRAGPLRSIHQELQLARARDPSVYGSVGYVGIPGLTLGGALLTGRVGQGQDFLARNSRLTLGEAHARWQDGPWDLSALYSRGTLSDTQELNTSFVGLPTPVPKAFWGAFGQVAYRAWENEGSSLVPFLRNEAINTASSYAAQPQGLGIPAQKTEHVATIGASYYLNPSVVLKLDYQDYKRTDEALGYTDRFNLGLGFQF